MSFNQFFLTNLVNIDTFFNSFEHRYFLIYRRSIHMFWALLKHYSRCSSAESVLSNGRPIPLISRLQTFFFGDISRGMCTKTIHRVSKTWKQRFVSKSAKFPGQCAKELFKILRRELGLVLPTTGLTSSNDCSALKELKTYEYFSYRCSKLLKNVSMFTKFC